MAFTPRISNGYGHYAVALFSVPSLLSRLVRYLSRDRHPLFPIPDRFNHLTYPPPPPPPPFKSHQQLIHTALPNYSQQSWSGPTNPPPSLFPQLFLHLKSQSHKIMPASPPAYPPASLSRFCSMAPPSFLGSQPRARITCFSALKLTWTAPSL